MAAALVVGPIPPLFAESDEVLISVTLAQGYSPSAVEATTGTTIIWRNDELANIAALPDAIGRHQVVAEDGSFESPVLISKASWSMTFNDPGTIAYRCKIHPQLMTGSLTFTGAAIKPEPLERTVKIVEPDPNVPDTYGYDPKNIVVKAGTTITWRNEGTLDHTVTADDKSFDSGTIPPGGTYVRTFKTTTALRYHCDPHPWMTGVVRVAGKGGKPPPPPPPPNQGSSPPPAPPTQEREGSGPTTFGVNVVEPNAADPNSWGFAPASLTARVGDTIKWTNTGGTDHTVTADDGSFDSGTLGSGATYELVLEKTGTIAYHCDPHPWMKASIAVVAASAPVPDPPASGGVIPPVQQPGGGTNTPPDEEPAIDPAAADRRVLAFGVGAAIVVMGAAFIVPVLIDRRRRTPTLPRTIDLTERNREPVGVG